MPLGAMHPYRSSLVVGEARDLAHMHHWNRRPLSPVSDRMTTLPIVLDSYDLAAAERRLCAAALETAGGIVPAAQLLGITRHALKRRLIKHHIEWPPHTP